MHLQPIFAMHSYYGSGISSDLFEQGLCLPSGTAMSDEEVVRVANIVRLKFS